MVSKKSRSEIRVKKHNRLRNHLSGTTECPRLAVFRSNNHMYAQIINDTVGKTLVAASTVEADLSLIHIQMCIRDSTMVVVLEENIELSTLRETKLMFQQQLRVLNMIQTEQQTSH